MLKIRLLQFDGEKMYIFKKIVYLDQFECDIAQDPTEQDPMELLDLVPKPPTLGKSTNLIKKTQKNLYN